MKKANNLNAQKSDLASDGRDPVTTIEEVIVLAGGVKALSRVIDVSSEDLNRWKKQGSIPLGKAMVIGYLYGIAFQDLLSKHDALWFSLMQLERSLQDTKAELAKTLKRTSSVLDLMAQLLNKYSANNGVISENGE